MQDFITKDFGVHFKVIQHVTFFSKLATSGTWQKKCVVLSKQLTINHLKIAVNNCQQYNHN